MQCYDIQDNFLLLSPGILENPYYMKQPDLYYFEAIKMKSQAWSKFTKNNLLRLVFSMQNLTRLVTSFYDFYLLTNWLAYLYRRNKVQGPTLCPTEGRALRGPRALDSPV